MKRAPPERHASEFGVIRLRYRARTQTLTYEQRGGNQTTVDHTAVSLDGYVHALYGLALQHGGARVLMIGCAGGTLATMLTRAGKRVTVVDIDKVSFKLAARYFSLPRKVKRHVGEGLAFMAGARRPYDVLVVDAFVGEDIPSNLRGAAFFDAVRRCVRDDGLALVNVCLARCSDRRADAIAAAFSARDWAVRLLDGQGHERNAIVAAGAVQDLKRPKMITPPHSGAAQTRSDLESMRFRAVSQA